MLDEDEDAERKVNSPPKFLSIQLNSLFLGRAHISIYRAVSEPLEFCVSVF